MHSLLFKLSPTSAVVLLTNFPHSQNVRLLVLIGETFGIADTGFFITV